MRKIRSIRTMCKCSDWAKGAFWNTELSGDEICLDGKQFSSGFVCLPVIDSQENGFRWNRVKIQCVLPEDCLLQVRCIALDELENPKEYRDFGIANIDSFVQNLPYEEKPMNVASALFGDVVARGPDFLLGKKGRYLYIMIELASASGQTPRISEVSVYMFGDNMTDYLPSIYHEDDFTRRFMSIFDSVHADMEQEIDSFSNYLDAEQTTCDMLSYMASWLCVDATGKNRETLLKQMQSSVSEYETMYTVRGVQNSVQKLIGETAMIIEAKDVDPNDPRCREPELYRRLYGEDLRKFFILLHENVFQNREQLDEFLEDMRVRVPAGVDMKLVLLKGCVQLDRHTYLGLNTVIQGYTPITIDDNSTIQYAMIGGEKHG